MKSFWLFVWGFLGLAGVGLCLTPATANPTCSIQVSGLAFGVYHTEAAAPTTGVGSVDWNCTGTGTVRLSLSTQSGGTVHHLHRVGSPATPLNYNLYLDANGLTVWGDGSPGTQVVSTAAPTGRLLFYGLIPPGQSVPAGQYQDTLLVQVDF